MAEVHCARGTWLNCGHVLKDMHRHMLIILRDGDAFRWDAETRQPAYEEGCLSMSREGLVITAALPAGIGFLPDSQETDRVRALIDGRELAQSRSRVMLTDPERRLVRDLITNLVKDRHSHALEDWTEQGDGELLLLADRFWPDQASVVD